MDRKKSVDKGIACRPFAIHESLFFDMERNRRRKNV